MKDYLKSTPQWKNICSPYQLKKESPFIVTDEIVTDKKTGKKYRICKLTSECGNKKKWSPNVLHD